MVRCRYGTEFGSEALGDTGSLSISPVRARIGTTVRPLVARYWMNVSSNRRRASCSARLLTGRAGQR